MKEVADPLIGAWEKRKRGKQHIEAFEACLVEFLRDHAYHLVSDPKTSAIKRAFLIHPAPIPGTLVCIVGDAVHNLRSALDHLAFSVAKHNGASKTMLRDVAFTIRRTRDDFNAALNAEQVRGIGPMWPAFLKSVEPYHGGDGESLYVLSVLDNIDKHRSLLAHQLLGDKYRFDGTHMIPVKSGVPLEQGIKLLDDAVESSGPAYTQIRISLNEAIPGLDPDSWVHETLNRLSFEVAKVLAFAETKAADLFPKI